MSGRLPDKGTTRRIISDFFLSHRSLIMPHVLEVGSARPANAWWADIQAQLGMEDEEWTGVDMQNSECTDIEVDMASTHLRFPGEHHPVGGFGSCVCAETLEHTTYPAEMLWNIRALLRPGAWIVITTPFAFPVHGFPNDYWRFTPEGMRLLLRDAGFENAQAWELESQSHTYWDHLKTNPWHPPPADEAEFIARIEEHAETRLLPSWVGAIARKPE